ncbi:hypothetical protein [Streptomyces lavendulae]|uniref:hypothetical protein n=1 Tax=Streptomyces lavendulae TaxID=1914 RepID=UPI00380E8433
MPGPQPLGNPDLKVTVRDYHQPRVTADVYTVEVTHELRHDKLPPDYHEQLPEKVEKSFEVRAVQFLLDPGHVHSFYPPDRSIGRYTHVLPHVTLNRDVLPWERRLHGARTAERAPWLALLVFTADELPNDPAASGLLTERPVSELLTTPTGVHGPDTSPSSVPPDVLDSFCRTIDVPAEVFTRIVPTEEELLYAAHTREVTLPPTRANGEVPEPGQFAVVTANRFARSEGGYAIHLVSLEGFEGRLDPGSFPDGDLVRLCSLHAWSFTCDTTNTLDPDGLLRHLAAPSLADPENLALKLSPPAGPSTAYIDKRLRRGFAPVAHRLATGHLTYAWYRGPATPVTAPGLDPAIPVGPYASSDHLLVYEPEHGIFDVSYAAAWTLGRAMALADPDYSSHVVRARRELANRAILLSRMEDDRQLQSIDPDEITGLQAFTQLAEQGPATLDALAQPGGPTRTRWTPRPALRDTTAVSAVLSTARTRHELVLTATRLTSDLGHWLDRLVLLHGVPFCYLAPYADMLPAETLRMFRLDGDWLAALRDGAQSIAVHTPLDAALDPLLRQTVARTATTPPPGAGILIRSELIRAWPEFDLTVTAGGEPQTELRRDRLADDVLLVLYERVPDQVFVREPGEGIHFGIGGTGRIGLREVHEGAENPVGAPTDRFYPPEHDSDTVFTRHLRPVAEGQLPDVLDLRGARALLPNLATAIGVSLDELRPSQYALQLINAPYQQLLRPKEADTTVISGSAS